MSSFHVLYLYHICTQNTDPTTVHLNLSFRNLPVCRISDLSSKRGYIACRERFTLSRAVKNPPPVSSQPAHTHLTSILMSPSDHVPSPAELCRRAAPGHSYLTAALPAFMSSLCPRSPAQISSRGCHFFLPTHLPWDIRGSPQPTAPERQQHCDCTLKSAALTTKCAVDGGQFQT